MLRGERQEEAAMLPRHEVPTHLHVEDRVFFGFMTVRHVLVLAGGGFFCLGAVVSPPLPLPEALRYLSALVIAAVTLAVAFVEPDGRPMEEWLLAVARYTLSPRVAVWRPLATAWEEDEARAGVLLLGEGQQYLGPSRDKGPGRHRRQGEDEQMALRGATRTGYATEDPYRPASSLGVRS